jgi:cytoskeleton protein RodZ
MESFGEKLRETRENLGYSIEQIARDTHIAKKYLIALENEDFSIFPGETYLKGFLQNYSEYLGLDPEVMIDIYKNMKIQEQPVPLDQLLDTKPGRRRLPVVIGIFLGLAVVAAVVLVFIFANPLAPAADGESAETKKHLEFLYKGKADTIYAVKGFLIKVPVNNEETHVTMQKITDSAVTLAYKDGDVDLRVGQQQQLDLDMDGRSDISFILKEIFTEQNQRKARLSVQPPTEETGLAIASNTDDLQLIKRGIAKVIREASTADPFTVDVTVIRNCFTVYYLDKKAREEKMAYKGDTFALSADQSADIRFTDGGAVKLRISGNELETGRTGEIYACRITWVNTGDGTFKLALIPIT